jgi:hypothetical protein
LANSAKCRLTLGGKQAKFKRELDDLDRGIAAMAEQMRQSRAMDPELAESRAINEHLRVKQLHKRQAILATRAKLEALNGMAEAEDGFGGWLMSMIVPALRGGVTNKTSVEILAKVHQARAMEGLAEGMERMRSRWFGLSQNRQFLNDVGLAVHGKKVADADAMEIAKAWGKSREYLRSKFNELGGDIKQRNDFGLRQTHNDVTIRRAGREAWVEHIEPLVDGERMQDAILAILASEQRSAPVTGTQLKEALGVIYDNIVSGGASSRTTAVKNRHLSPRVIAFKDADSWLAYNSKFGIGDTYSAMVQHIDEMSREIAMMERFGPNPKALYEELKDEVVAGGYGGMKVPLMSELSTDEMKVEFLDAVMRQQFGEDTVASSVIANTFQAIRSTITSAVLGGATLASIPDMGTSALTAAYNKMGVVKTLKRQLEAVFGGAKNTKELRIAARRMGIIFDAAASRVLMAHEATGAGVSNKMAEFTIRGSGLAWWTDMNKVGFGMAIAADMADAFVHKFDVADEGFNGMFSRHGWTADDWDALRGLGAWDFQGSKFASLEKITGSSLPDATKDRLADLLVGTMSVETRFAIPEPSTRTLAVLRGKAQRGALGGEMLRSTFMFKSFAVEMATGHGSRMFFQPTNGDSLKYAAAMIAATTVGGAASYQLKAISRGREPMDMTRPQFWGAALLQGGGGTLLTDFVVAAGGADRFGHSFVVSQLGPMAGLADDVAGIFGGTVNDTLGGGDAGPAARTVKTVARYLPGSSIFWARMAFERGVVDNLMTAVDPRGARRSFAAQERYYKKMGQPFFVKPGALTK